MYKPYVTRDKRLTDANATEYKDTKGNPTFGNEKEPCDPFNMELKQTVVRRPKCHLHVR